MRSSGIFPNKIYWLANDRSDLVEYKRIHLLNCITFNNSVKIGNDNYGTRDISAVVPNDMSFFQYCVSERFHHI